MKCLDFFTENSGNQNSWAELIKHPHELLLQWESESASLYSPAGPVLNEEILVRRVLSPAHYDSLNKILKPTAFEDTGSRGLSVNREAHTSIAEITAVALERPKTITKIVDGVAITKPAPNIFWGYAKLKTYDIRMLTSLFDVGIPEVRTFGIYDTGLDVDNSHADVFQIASKDGDEVAIKAFGRSARSKLVDVANRMLTAF